MFDFPFVVAAAQLTKDSLVQDLSSVLLVAGIVAAVFHWLGWPKVIGYIAAGSLIRLGPFRDLMIADEDSINVLANLGVIFLMLNLGLDLNIRKLRRAGGTVFPAAVLDLGMMLLIGYGLGRHVLGWDLIPSLFMGAVICDSSTTLLAKSLAEMGCLKEKFASLIFGTTISEDVLTIGVMAVLTGLAMTGHFQAWELVHQLLLLGLFLAGVMIFGLLLLPPLLNKLLSRLRDEETLLLIIMGICFGISLVAERMQFSLALGAFLVGAVIGESKVRKRVVAAMSGLRSVFSAVFFVTIGMMVVPSQMWANKWSILMFVIAVIVGKTLNSFVACLATGQTFRDSFQVGVGLAQIGDFAYLVALLGMNLQHGARPFPEMYQIAVGVSILTTLLNPFLLRHSGKTADWMFAHLPVKVRSGLENYARWSRRTGDELKHRDVRKRFVRHCVFYVLNMVLMGVVFMVGAWLFQYEPLWSRMPRVIRAEGEVSMWIACTLLSLPLMVNGYLLSRGLGNLISSAFLPQRGDRFGHWQPRLRRLAEVVVSLCLMAGLCLEYSALSNLVFFNMWVFMGMIVMLVGGFIIGWERLHKMVSDAQQALRDVVEGEEMQEEESLSSGGRHECKVEIPEGAGVVGVSLGKLRLRNHTGATVARILRRDGTQVSTPGAEDVLQAGDVAIMLCTEAREEGMKAYMTGTTVEIHEARNKDVVSVVLPDSSGALGVSLRKLRLRNHTGATVLRIRRAGGELVGSPGPDTMLLAGDTVELLCRPGTCESVRSYLCGSDVEIHEDSLSVLLDMHVERYRLPPGSPLCGPSLGALRLRNRFGVTVASIERGGRQLPGMPGPEDVLCSGDVVSFMGTTEQLSSVQAALVAP